MTTKETPGKPPINRGKTEAPKTTTKEVKSKDPEEIAAEI